MKFGSSTFGAAHNGSFCTSRLVLRGDGTVACRRPARVTVIQPVRPGVMPGPGSSPGLPGSAAAGPVTAIAAMPRRWVPALGAGQSLQLGPERLAGPRTGWPPGTRAEEFNLRIGSPVRQLSQHAAGRGPSTRLRSGPGSPAGDQAKRESGTKWGRLR